MIIEIIPFNFEILNLEIKLQTHWKYVDKFIILESNLSFTGSKKPIYSELHEEIFQKYSKKVQIIKFIYSDEEIQKLNNQVGSINREHVSRHFFEIEVRSNFSKNLFDQFNFPEDSIFILTDTDEVLYPEFLQSIKSKTLFIENLISIKLKPYSNKLNLYADKNYQASTVASYKYMKLHGYLKCCKLLRDLVKHNLDELETFSGWHFQNLMTPEDYVTKKVADAPRYEEDDDSLDDRRALNIEEANSRLEKNLPMNGLNSSGGVGRPLKKEDLNNLPKYVQNNYEKFKDWLCP